MVQLCDHTLPTVNTTLEPPLCSKQVLRAAKLAEVPRDIIDRNLKKATDKSQADYAEVCSKAQFPACLGVNICLTVTRQQALS